MFVSIGIELEVLELVDVGTTVAVPKAGSINVDSSSVTDVDNSAIVS